MSLIPGQNIQLNTSSFSLQLDAGYVPDNCQLESSAFATDSSGKVRSKEDYIHTHQLNLPGDGVIRSASGQIFTIDLEKLPLNVECISIAISIINTTGTHHSVRSLKHLSIASDKETAACFQLDTQGKSELSLILCDIYRRGDNWKFKAVGQGFNDGLITLASHFGVTL